MKHLLLVGAVLLGGCSMFGHKAPASGGGEIVIQQEPAAAAGGMPIEGVPFRIGVSSATVEKMARQQACRGGLGAGLVTAPGPVEVYRMRCDNGKVFMARCELRQCKKM